MFYLFHSFAIFVQWQHIINHLICHYYLDISVAPQRAALLLPSVHEGLELWQGARIRRGSPLLGNNLGVTPPFIGRSKNLDCFSLATVQ